jgi:peptide/nickel transport system ATP-binding protein
MEEQPLLEIRGLRTHFFTSAGVLKVLDGLDLVVRRNQILGLLGESGSGKSVTAYSVLGLIHRPGKVVGGSVALDGVELLSSSERALRRVRGRDISMIFQNPRMCLNPLRSVGGQLTDVLSARKKLTEADSRGAAVEMLRKVALPDPKSKMNAYPHQLSTGMCQRVMIALALACEPRLLIADEATTGLDVTIQYQIVQLLKELATETGMSQIIITHDLGIAAEMCQAVVVMYAGRIVESAPVVHLFDHPRHPYTLGLLGCRPRMGYSGVLEPIPGSVPDYVDLPSGCRFHPRCSKAREVCSDVVPELSHVGETHLVACHFPEA